MTATNLRALAKDYANGVIDREKYRKARAELIEGILAGDIKVESREFIAPVESGDDTDITEEKTSLKTEPEAFKSTNEFEKPPLAGTDEKPARKQPPEKSSQKWIIGSAIVIIICSIVIVALLLQGEEVTEPDTVGLETIPPEPVAPDTTNEPPVANPTAGIELIAQFLAGNNWQQENIDQFITDWRELSDIEQQTALSSPVLTQLNNAIYQQLLEERALAGLVDPDKINSRQETLVGLAETVGIYDNRLTVQKVRATASSPKEAPEQPWPAVEEQMTVQGEPAADTPASEQETITKAAAPPVVQPDEPAAPKVEEAGSSVTEQMIKDTAPVTETAESEVVAAAESTGPATDSESIDAQPVSDSADAGTAPAAVQKESTTNCKPSLSRQRRPYCRDDIADIGKAPTMVVLPAGKFMMGGEKPEEQPRHEVTINKPFAISVNEITQGEFELFCTDTGRSCPSQPWSEKDYPVVNVTWNDAVAYTRWQSEKTGNTYRLPTEAEWEYAARGKTTTPYPFGEEVLITDAVFSDVKQLSSPLPKSDRSINRNNFKLYHMVGNVREWVLDPWHDNYSGAPTDGSVHSGSGITTRVVRGGSYADPAEALRSAARLALEADASDNQTGFRIVQEIQ